MRHQSHSPTRSQPLVRFSANGAIAALSAALTSPAADGFKQTLTRNFAMTPPFGRALNRREPMLAGPSVEPTRFGMPNGLSRRHNGRYLSGTGGQMPDYRTSNSLPSGSAIVTWSGVPSGSFTRSTVPP